MSDERSYSAFRPVVRTIKPVLVGVRVQRLQLVCLRCNQPLRATMKNGRTMGEHCGCATRRSR